MFQDRQSREHTSPRIKARVLCRACIGRTRTDWEGYVKSAYLLEPSARDIDFIFLLLSP